MSCCVDYFFLEAPWIRECADSFFLSACGRRHCLVPVFFISDTAFLTGDSTPFPKLCLPTLTLWSGTTRGGFSLRNLDPARHTSIICSKGKARYLMMALVSRPFAVGMHKLPTHSEDLGVSRDSPVSRFCIRLIRRVPERRGT